MTLTAALAKADRQYDDIAERNLLDTAAMIRDMGGDDAEVEAFVARQRAALARSRAAMHEWIAVLYATGFDSPSVRVH